jgi:hypothetical protein
MLISHRRYSIPDVLIALVIIEAAMIGVVLAAGSPALVYERAEQFVLDVLLLGAYWENQVTDKKGEV